MRAKKGQFVARWALLVSLVMAGQAGEKRFLPSPQERPAWWQIILHLETRGDYHLESGDRTSAGDYSFTVRWRGFMERDDDDYILYVLDSDLREWNAAEITFAEEAMIRSTTADFKDRPSLVFNYIIRKDQQLHVDFMISGIVVPQTESEDSLLLLFPSSAENNQRGQQVNYNHHVTGGSNRITLNEEEIYAGRVDRTYSWSWKNRSWTLKPNRTVSTTHSHAVVVRLSVIPRYSRSD